MENLPIFFKFGSMPGQYIMGITVIAAGSIEAVLSFMQNQYCLFFKRRWDESPLIQIDSELPFTSKYCDGLPEGFSRVFCHLQR